MSAVARPVPVILAAGTGSRLGVDGPKCLVEVGGRPILGRTLGALRAAGLHEAVIVAGFAAARLERFIGEQAPDLRLRFVVNDAFATTGTARSLSLGIGAVAGDRSVVIIEADVAFEDTLLSDLLAGAAPDAVALGREQPFHSGSVVTLDANGLVERWYHERTRPRTLARGDAWKTVNLNRFAASTWADVLLPALAATEATSGPGAPAEYAYAMMVDSGAVRIAGLDVGARTWFEVDTPDDLALAERLFAERGA